MVNVPKVKAGIVAVSRDCFPKALSETRRGNVAAACKEAKLDVAELRTVIEGERDVAAALAEAAKLKVNALVIYLGNFGPEGPETLLAKGFGGPVMFAAAGEETGSNMVGGRGDAYCGMLNASYNLGLRKVRAYIPDYPVGIPSEIAAMVGGFLPIAAMLLGIRSLKVFGFGPRPYDFLACNAPIKQLFDMGVEVMENSELDLFESYKAHEKDKRIGALVKEMAAELGKGNAYPDVLTRLAQYELTLVDWYEKNLGASSYAVFANKCWPAFQTQFKFVPCYVNSRMASRGIPIACETDIYGAVSEYLVQIATGVPATLLDINNTVPGDMYKAAKSKVKKYANDDLFMGFHCGNTPKCHLKAGAMKYQLIMHSLLEPDSEPDITRGTLEGTIAPSGVTLFRIQGAADGRLTSYVAEGEVLDVDDRSFGGIGVIAISEMARFYRHVLIEDRYPHHTAVGFGHAGKALFEAARLIGADKVSYNQPKSLPYATENPF
ncbi:MAG: fucose isomerase [Oscillospiraceae bacterium]|nr:fucose isomerase [Oscillospiraceae bacterium]